MIDIPEGVTDPIDIAVEEFEKDVVPMTVVRRLPTGERVSGEEEA